MRLKQRHKATAEKGALSSRWEEKMETDRVTDRQTDRQPEWGDNLLIISECSAQWLTLMEREWCPSNSSNFSPPLYLCFISPAIPSPQNTLSAPLRPPPFHISCGSYKMPASSSCIKARGRYGFRGGCRRNKWKWDWEEPFEFSVCGLNRRAFSFTSCFYPVVLQ